MKFIVWVLFIVFLWAYFFPVHNRRSWSFFLWSVSFGWTWCDRVLSGIVDAFRWFIFYRVLLLLLAVLAALWWSFGSCDGEGRSRPFRDSAWIFIRATLGCLFSSFSFIRLAFGLPRIIWIRVGLFMASLRLREILRWPGQIGTFFRRCWLHACWNIWSFYLLREDCDPFLCQCLYRGRWRIWVWRRFHFDRLRRGEVICWIKRGWWWGWSWV